MNVVTVASAEAELDETTAGLNDAIYKLDTDRQTTFVNRRAEEVIQRSEKELRANPFGEEFSEARNDIVEHQYRMAMERQVSVSFEYYFEPLVAWVQINAYPDQAGLSLNFQDITGRKIRQYPP